MFQTLLDVFTGILLMFIGWLVPRLYTYIKMTRPLSKVLGSLADVSKHTVIVIPKLYSPPSETIKLKRPNNPTEFINWHPSLPLFAEGDAKAMMYIYNLLLKSGKKTRTLKIKSDTEVTGEEKGCNLVCIGAGSNSLTKDFLAAKSLPLNFEQQVMQETRIFGLAIVDRETGEKWITDQIHDYGLIIRFKGLRADVLLLAGLGPSGTAASGYFISNRWREIYDYLKVKKAIDRNYAVLLRTRIADHTDVTLIKILAF